MLKEKEHKVLVALYIFSPGYINHIQVDVEYLQST